MNFSNLIFKVLPKHPFKCSKGGVIFPMKHEQQYDFMRKSKYQLFIQAAE